MAASWYYSKDGKQIGPISWEQLKELATSGELRPVEHVWKEGTPGWVSARAVPGLLPDDPSKPSSPDSETKKQRAPEPDFAAQAKETAREASRNALTALKTLSTNPVGGLRESFDQLGPAAAMRAGVAFQVALALCVTFGAVLFSRGQDFLGTFVKGLLAGVTAPLSLTAATMLARKILKGAGSWQSDLFIAGAALVPAALAMLISSVLGPKNIEIVTLVNIFALSLTVLMLQSGCSKIMSIAERPTTLAVPLMLVLTVLLSSVIYRIL